MTNARQTLVLKLLLLLFVSPILFFQCHPNVNLSLFKELQCTHKQGSTTTMDTVLKTSPVHRASDSFTNAAYLVFSVMFQHLHFPINQLRSRSLLTLPWTTTNLQRKLSISRSLVSSMSQTTTSKKSQKKRISGIRE